MNRSSRATKNDIQIQSIINPKLIMMKPNNQISLTYLVDYYKEKQLDTDTSEES